VRQVGHLPRTLRNTRSSGHGYRI